MKKIIVLIFAALIVSPVFAGGLSAQINAGYGVIDGTRYKTTEENAHNIKASGLEVGTVLAYMFGDVKRGWGIEAYFDYLFAFRGAWDKVKVSRLAAVPSDMKYTDYKAGLGAQYRLPLSEKFTLKLSSGLNFAGVSNHTYKEDPKKISNQIAGRKVTSFGFYFDTGVMYNVEKHIALSLGVHSCVNPFGFIRNFDAEKHGWVNHFDVPSRTKCFTTFCQLGFIIQ